MPLKLLKSFFEKEERFEDSEALAPSFKTLMNMKKDVFKIYHHALSFTGEESKPASF